MLALAIHHPVGNELAPLLSDRPLVVGRSPPADLVLPDPRLSKTHVRFFEEEGAVVAEDLDSRNGTWLRGMRVRRARLNVGDELLIGSTMARVILMSRDAPAPPLARAAVPRERVPQMQPDVVANARMQALFELADRIASSRMPVLLRGETGTGKEVLARRIHARRARGAQPMVCVNCAAIANQLIESTLFGHERGAFTGAHVPRKGVFEEADGGTLFLDEIGELPPAAQAALLRVIETGTFHRVGSAREIRVDVRIVAATHRDLAAMVRAGTFRDDLLYRLNGLTLELPPLRDRPEDIRPLAFHFLQIANEANGRAIASIAPDALDALMQYAWPGNVRELRNAVERAVVVTQSERVERGDLPPELRDGRLSDSLVPPPSVDGAFASEADEAGDRGLKSAMRQYEAQMIAQALRDAGGKRKIAAQRLGMPLRSLAHKIKSLGILGVDDDDDDDA